MYLKSIGLTNFKNYLKAELNFSDKFICFTGNNGQGKTNLLDAIYYLSYTKSFVNINDISNIHHGQDFFRIIANFILDDNTHHEVKCIQKINERKKIVVNDKPRIKFAEHIGEFPIVIISPADFFLLLQVSADRRKFIDSTISQFNKKYLDSILQYNRVLFQRNKLLKAIFPHRGNYLSLLEPFDFKLIEHGTIIHDERKEFLKNFVPYFNDAYRNISKSNENVDIIYDSELNGENLENLLFKHIRKDIALQHTTSGIHRDDFDFRINSYPLKKYGSQGQQKTFLVSLKLAQHKYIFNQKNIIPLLLIDDIYDKLDANRVEHLFCLLDKGNYQQVFITDTQQKRLEELFRNVENNRTFYNICNDEIVKS